ncbi:MAG: histone deacetylase [Deltaproteobacteria bacterium]|nr:histone deacetylase [Deltaproteobacteria bacterium]
MTKVGQVFHPQYLKHDTGPLHPERADRLRAILEKLKSRSLESQLIEVPVREASEREVTWIHSEDYFKNLAKTAEKPSRYLDPDTPVSGESFEAALLATGGVLEATLRVAEGDLDTAFALVRPPGHHAEADHAMGFCLINNVAVAAEFLQKKLKYQKIAIVDFDVHHGNGTQHSFYDREDIFYASLHRYPFYPGTGSADEKGKGAGLGYTLNLPLSQGAGDEIYLKVFEQKLLPTLREYSPDFLLVSAGFDAHRQDPLGGMRVTEEGFAKMTQALQNLAQDFCGGKTLYVLEGGYDLEGLSTSVCRVLEVLLEKK